MRLPLALLIFIALISPAFAQTVASSSAEVASVVVVPVGGWVEQIAPILQDALLALVTGLVAFALRSLPAAIRTYVTAGITAQVEQIVDKGIDWAVAAVAGATKDKIWSIPVGNAVVAKAVQYVIDHGPAWLITWAGGQAMITQKIIARVGDLLPDNAQVTGGTTISASSTGVDNSGAAAPITAVVGTPSTGAL